MCRTTCTKSCAFCDTDSIRYDSGRLVHFAAAYSTNGWLFPGFPTQCYAAAASVLTIRYYNLPSNGTYRSFYPNCIEIFLCRHPCFKIHLTNHLRRTWGGVPWPDLCFIITSIVDRKFFLDTINFPFTKIRRFSGSSSILRADVFFYLRNLLLSHLRNPQLKEMFQSESSGGLIGEDS